MCSLMTVQILVVVSHTMCAHVGYGAPPPWDKGSVDNALETRYCLACVITPNFVALHVRQNVWAQVRGSRNLAKLGPFGMEARLIP